MKAKGKRKKKKLNDTNQSRGPLKYAFFSIIFYNKFLPLRSSKFHINKIRMRRGLAVFVYQQFGGQQNQVRKRVLLAHFATSYFKIKNCHTLSLKKAFCLLAHSLTLKKQNKFW